MLYRVLMEGGLSQRCAGPCSNVGPVLCYSSLLLAAAFAVTPCLMGQVTNVSCVLLGPLLKK